MDWFENWFNTPYYHILYNHRDDKEAEIFIDNLFDRLKIPKQANILDLACGKGRHSIYMNQKGNNVLGVDISHESIKDAKRYENKQLKFKICDIRQDLSRLGKFDIVTNLFTSFGYFDTEEEHQNTILNISNLLHSKSLFIIDFMNVNKVLNRLITSEIQSREDISFDIKRRIEGGFIKKDIEFTHGSKNYYFQEKVKALTLQDFKMYFEKSDLDIIDIFGNYHLDTFDLDTSDRLILITRKKWNILY